MNSLSLTELTGLDYFRGLANPDKEMDTGFQHRSHAYSPGIFKSHKKTVFNRTKTFTKPLSWNQEVSHIKCLSEKYVNLPRASFPHLPASQGSDSLLVPHFNIGQIDINLVGPQSRGWRGANLWESKVGDGWWEEVLKRSCTVKCPVGGSVKLQGQNGWEGERMRKSWPPYTWTKKMAPWSQHVEQMLMALGCNGGPRGSVQHALRTWGTTAKLLSPLLRWWVLRKGPTLRQRACTSFWTGAVSTICTCW